eukprot:g19529.t1
MLSSKSWPQMSITWAMLAEVPPATTVALGNWVDKPADTQRSEMPLRYTGFWRCVLRLFANGVTQPEKVLMWDELGHKLYVATRERSFDRASTVLQAKEVVFFTASSDEIHFQKANSLMQRIFHDSRDYITKSLASGGTSATYPIASYCRKVMCTAFVATLQLPEPQFASRPTCRGV